MPSSSFQLAQINIATLLAPEGEPIVEEFFANVAQINQLAEHSPGFVWRYDGDYPEPLIAFNMSVWESVESLSEFTYRSAHVDIFRRRSEWFKKMTSNHMALWWIAKDHIPTVQEGQDTLKQLDQFGPSKKAFTFKQRFNAPANRKGHAQR